MQNWQRVERLIRSRILGSPFVLSNMLTRYEIEGQEHLLAALARRHEKGNGLITVSNHQSLFDDPLILAALLGLRDFTVETKCWWSTPCESNFSPRGKGLAPRFVRYFSDVSNMCFFARAYKGKKVRAPKNYLETLRKRAGDDLVRRLEERAMSLGVDGETYLRGTYTTGAQDKLGPLNQAGMVEAIARINTGDWMHFFPEGGRSRTLDLRKPKKGVGKVMYFCPDAEVLPICFAGMHDVMPVKAKAPRPFQRVVITVGRPLPGSHFEQLRRKPATADTFKALAKAAFGEVEAMWPDTLSWHFNPKARQVVKRHTADLAMERAANDEATYTRLGTTSPHGRPRAQA